MSILTKENYPNINYCIRCGTGLEFKEDHEGKLRPKCPACHWIYYKNPVPAVAIVVFNEKNELLIIKRLNEPKAGTWSLPSGYMEIYQTPEDTAVDEMEEETGLLGEVIHFIGYYSGHSVIYEQVLSLGFNMKVTGGLLSAGDDAAEACYVPLDKLPPIAFAAHRYFIHKEMQRLDSEFPIEKA
jgi:8-oxo-dGTP diphosphatase